MRIAVAGTRSFGAAVYRRLIAHGYQVPLVFTERVGAIGSTSLAAHIHYDGVKRDLLADYGVELVVAAHWTRLIGPKSRLVAPVLIGHPSLLPRHRGRSAVEWTIRQHDPIAGFTWFLADGGYDTGPIVAQSWCHVAPGWTASDLWRERLYDLGLELLLPAVADASYGGRKQDSRFATWEPPIVHEAPTPAT